MDGRGKMEELRRYEVKKGRRKIKRKRRNRDTETRREGKKMKRKNTADEEDRK